MKYALIGSGSAARPAPKQLAPVIEVAVQEVGVQPTSLARTQPAVDFARKRGAVLSSQAELYAGYIQGRPGFNPANPPGRSTHEGKNDGVAYRIWPAFFSLPWWAWGQDWPDSSVQAVLACYRDQGWTASITYPGSASEYHHINLRRLPVIHRALQHGDSGRAVKKLQRNLHFLVRPDQKVVPSQQRGDHYYARGVTGDFDAYTESALQVFQKDHHLERSGKVDQHTAAQLKTSVRDRKAKLAAKRSKR